MESNLLGVRKGAWTKEEDDLLRHFIEKHGEGKWHQVPLKAGLNRCRKSCRLRWLNYLKPNIKRGEFAEDEIDLMIRLHKLLGNRWSLIAGRLVGRTANDVKNYWNCQRQKKMACDPEKRKDKSQETTTTSTIRRPQPRTFKNLSHLEGKVATLEHIQSEENFSMSLPTSPPTENGFHWWKQNLLDDENLFTNFWVEDMTQSARLGVHSVEEGTRVSDFSFHENLWNFSRDEKIET